MYKHKYIMVYDHRLRISAIYKKFSHYYFILYIFYFFCVFSKYLPIFSLLIMNMSIKSQSKYKSYHIQTQKPELKVFFSAKYVTI